MVLLYPVTEVPVEVDYDQESLTLRVRQFDPRKIYDPATGRLNVDDTIEELGRALAQVGVADGEQVGGLTATR